MGHCLQHLFTTLNSYVKKSILMQVFKFITKLTPIQLTGFNLYSALISVRANHRLVFCLFVWGLRGKHWTGTGNCKELGQKPECAISQKVDANCAVCLSDDEGRRGYLCGFRLLTVRFERGGRTKELD
jgi:hypothetical protein